VERERANRFCAWRVGEREERELEVLPTAYYIELSTNLHEHLFITVILTVSELTCPSPVDFKKLLVM